MPLTKQIIQTVVRDEIRAELEPLNLKIDTLADKVDNLTNIFIDFAGSVKKFDEEQVLLSARVSDTIERVEKLEFAV